LILIGGRGDNNKLFGDIFVFDLKNCAWVKPKVSGDAPSATYYHAAVTVGNRCIYMLGGNVSFV